MIRAALGPALPLKPLNTAPQKTTPMTQLTDTIAYGLKKCEDLPAIIAYLSKTTETLKKRPLIFYHANCVDGFTSAYFAWKKFGDAAEYVPLHAGKQPEYIGSFKDRDLYFLDVSPGKHYIERVIDEVASVTVIDHHVKTLDDLGGYEHKKVTLILDKEHSGAVLCYKAFKVCTGFHLACLVEDYDLWKFELDETRAVNAYLEIVPMTFKAYQEVADTLDVPRAGGPPPTSWKTVLKPGEMLLAQKATEVQRTLDDHPYLANLAAGSMVAINSTKNRNEISDAILKTYPNVDVVCVWAAHGNDIRVSLRSRKGGVNVNELAAKWAPGGGGHTAAAGCTFKGAVPALMLPWLTK